MSISLSEIRAFNAVVEEGNFTRAALALSVSQPAITAQIRKLESRSGHYLLERTPHGFELTPHGKRLYQVSKQYTDLGDALEAVLTPEAKPSIPAIKIATASALIFMPLLAKFRQAFPDTQLEVSSASSAQCQALVMNSEVDIGLFPLLEKHNQLSHFEYHRHRLVAIIPLDSELAALNQISIHLLAKQALIFSSSQCYTQRCLDQLLEAHNLEGASVMRLDHRYEIAEAVIHGLGIGFAFEDDIRQDAAYKLVPIIEAQDAATEHVVWLKSRSVIPKVQAFVDLALGQVSIGQAETAKVPSPSQTLVECT